MGERSKFPSHTRYATLPVRHDIADMLKKIASVRNLNVQELLEEFIEECVDECELNEIGYADYLDKD